MPHMTDERVRAGLAREEDLSLLEEVSTKTAGVSHLEMCIQCGTCGGSCPVAMDMDHTPRMPEGFNTWHGHAFANGYIKALIQAVYR